VQVAGLRTELGDLVRCRYGSGLGPRSVKVLALLLQWVVYAVDSPLTGNAIKSSN
jgi:hypothetical protein